MGQKTAVVAMSGGVDSAVAALLMCERYETLIGASHYIWCDSACCNTASMSRAREVCDRLGMPFFIIDLETEFRNAVVDDFIETYIQGRTPNPCVRCNEKIRFSLFYDRLERYLEETGIKTPDDELVFATGHYARVVKTGNRYYIAKGRDPVKDQSYMLSRIPAGMLHKLEFPLGEWTKGDVVTKAASHNLPSASVRESQDACFLADTEYSTFIVDHSEKKALHTQGRVFDDQGNYLGKSRGYIHYTVGQRKGLGLGNGPWYVKEIHPEKNIVVVARKGRHTRSGFSCSSINWFMDRSKLPMESDVKVRYQSSPVRCSWDSTEHDTLSVTLHAPAVVTPGQTAVFYEGDIVLASGIIQ